MQGAGAPSCDTTNLSSRHRALYDGCKSSFCFSIFTVIVNHEHKEKERKKDGEGERTPIRDQYEVIKS